MTSRCLRKHHSGKIGARYDQHNTDYGHQYEQRLRLGFTQVVDAVSKTGQEYLRHCVLVPWRISKNRLTNQRFDFESRLFDRRLWLEASNDAHGSPVFGVREDIRLSREQAMLGDRHKKINRPGRIEAPEFLAADADDDECISIDGKLATRNG